MKNAFRNKLTAIALCVAIAIPASRTAAQNLVANGDFESYDGCPTGPSDISFSPTYTSFGLLRDWVKPTAGTPDFMHSCATHPNLRTPDNLFGHQRPHSGNAYVGLIPFGSNGYSEYIATKLTQPLIKDSTYDIRFFVNMSEGGPYVDTTKYIFRSKVLIINEIGMNISDTLPVMYNNTRLNLPYQIVSDTAIQMTDTSRWYEVSGSYKAKGGEQWITLGTFRRTDTPAYFLVRDHPGNDLFSYAYIDDVSLTPRWKTQIPASVSELLLSRIRLHPNPATATLILDGLDAIKGSKTIVISTVAGNQASRQVLAPGSKDIRIGDLPSGAYFLQLQTDSGTTNLRFCKN